MTTDHRNQIPSFWIHDLHTCNTVMPRDCRLMEETLSVLDTAGAFKTWDVGHMIRNAVRQVESRLAFVSGISRGQTYTDTEIMDVRRRVFEATKQFCERPLLEEVRKAIREELQIEIERKWLDAGDANPHFGIAIPGTIENRADDAGDAERDNADGSHDTAGKAMTVEEANQKGTKLVKKYGRAFFAMSKRKQTDLIGCHYLTWEKTPLYLKAVEEGMISPPKPKSPKTFSLTSERESVIGEGEKDEIQKEAAEREIRRLIAEQSADAEPSPLDAAPAGRKRKVHSHKRL